MLKVRPDCSVPLSKKNSSTGFGTSNPLSVQFCACSHAGWSLCPSDHAHVARPAQPFEPRNAPACVSITACHVTSRTTLCSSSNYFFNPLD